MLTDEEIERWEGVFDEDCSMQNFWHKCAAPLSSLSCSLRPAADDRHAGRADGHSQEANYDALLTHPEWDEIIRHPAVYPLIEALMGGPTCLGEIGLRTMPPWENEFFQGWHRDCAHPEDHPFRLDYLQMMVYLSDVDEGTHCISFSPEDATEPLHKSNEEQLGARGEYHLHGPKGTVRASHGL